MQQDTKKAQIPESWTWTRLKEIARISDRDHKTPKYFKEGVPLISPKYFTPNGIDFSKIKYVNNEELERFKRKCNPEKGDIMYSRIGTIGEARIVDFSEPFVALHSIAMVKPERNMTTTKFLFYLLKSPKVKMQAIKNIKSVGTPDLGLTRINNFSVPLPPITEQYRITSKLEELFTRLDAGVASLQDVKTQLQIYRQAVLKHAFNGKLTEQWRKSHKKTIQPSTKILEQIELKQKPNKKSRTSPKLTIDISGFLELPEMWVSIMVKDITKSMKNGIYKPKQYYNENGIACLRMYNIQNGTIDWVDIKRMNLTKVEIEDYALRSGDILVNRVNSRELVGKSAVIPSELEPCVFESKNIRLRIIRNLMNSKFLNFWFLYFSQNYFNRNAQQTVGMASINQAQLGSMPVPFPSLTEQNVIVEKIEDIFSFCQITSDNVEKSIAKSEALRQSILKTAFEGNLVSQDPNDESAKMLLEQIKQHKAKQGKKRQRSLVGHVK